MMKEKYIQKKVTLELLLLQINDKKPVYNEVKHKELLLHY